MNPVKAALRDQNDGEWHPTSKFGYETSYYDVAHLASCICDGSYTRTVAMGAEADEKTAPNTCSSLAACGPNPPESA